MVFLKLAAIVATPLPAAPLEGAFNMHGLHTLLACRSHAEVTRKPVCAKNGLPLRPRPHYLEHPEDATGIPKKPTIRGVGVV